VRILTGLKVDLGVMAFVVQRAPQAFVNILRHETIRLARAQLPNAHLHGGTTGA
jgi:hypothetical protein